MSKFSNPIDVLELQNLELMDMYTIKTVADGIDVQRVLGGVVYTKYQLDDNLDKVIITSHFVEFNKS